MENQPQNPEFGNNPENFHPCDKYHDLIRWSQENYVPSP